MGASFPEVAVVGGGPAGAVTALLLARQGRRVVVVEREGFPRPKACGDCLSAAATALLAELRLLDAVSAAGAARLGAWRVRAPSGTECVGRFGAGVTALALERRLLDAVLLDAAGAAGAELVRGRARALIRDPTGRVGGIRFLDARGREQALPARLVVGADGLRSVVARRAGLVRRRPRVRKVSLTTHGVGPLGDLDHGEMHVLDGACFGLAPAGNGRFNLTLVVEDSRAGALAALGAEAFFHRWLARAPVIAERMGGSALDRPFLASGPFDWPMRSAAAPGLALVGDAAGYFDPFTGQGVYQAMAGARVLAGALERVDLRDGPAVDRALRGYGRAAARIKGPARRVQRVVETALRRPGRADRVLGRLAAGPSVMDRLVEVTGDLRRPISLLSPRLLSTFLFPPAPETR